MIPAGCEVCSKEILSERIIVLEEFQTRLIIWEELKAGSIIVFFTV
jgi:hypothetical protein